MARILRPGLVAIRYIGKIDTLFRVPNSFGLMGLKERKMIPFSLHRSTIYFIVSVSSQWMVLVDRFFKLFLFYMGIYLCCNKRTMA